MTQAHALDLRPDGIDLLAKRGARWLRVASTDPEGDLEAGMAALLVAAGGAAPVPVRAVLPRDQLLYAVLDGLPAEPMERFRAMRRALDGRTPYRVDELAFDWHDLSESSAVVCAVARETLDEVEGFLSAHGFAPLAFVAAPRPAADCGDAAEAAYAVEPLLSAGSAHAGDDAPVQRGGTPVRCAGDMPVPTTPTKTTESAAEIPVQAPVADAAQSEASPEAPSEMASDSASGVAAEIELAEVDGTDGDAESDLPVEDDEEVSSFDESSLSDEEPEPSMAAAPEPEAIAVLPFASRREPTGEGEPALGGKVQVHQRAEPRITFRPVPGTPFAPEKPATRPAAAFRTAESLAEAAERPKDRPAASDDVIPDAAPAFTRPRNRVDPRAADRLQAMRGSGRTATGRAEKRTPDEVIAAFAGLKDNGQPARRGLPIPFLGGLAAGIVVVGAVGGWMLLGGNDTGASDLPATSANTVELASMETARSVAEDSDPAGTEGDPFSSVFDGGEVIPVEPIEATAASAASGPALPDPEAAAVRTAPRALAAPGMGSEAAPQAAERLPSEDATLVPATASAAVLPADLSAADAVEDAVEPEADAPETVAASDPAETTQDVSAGPADPDRAVEVAAVEEFSGSAVQQSAPRRQSEPKPFSAGSVEVAAIPASWDGPRGTGALARPVTSSDDAPGVYLPPAPPGPEGVAAARPEPTADGAEGLDGVTLFAGDPPRTPPSRPEAPPTVLGSLPDPELVGFRPRFRSDESAARWLASEAAALDAATELAQDAADPTLASAEPAAAELATEPSGAGDPNRTETASADAASALDPAEVNAAVTRALATPVTTAQAADAQVELASADVTADPEASLDDAAPEALSIEGQPAGPGDPRPQRRPQTATITPVAADAIADALLAAEQFEFSTATAQAIGVSRRPGNRTTDLTRKAAAILEQRSREAAASVQTASVRAAPSSAPNLPTKASVARSATLENALPMRQTALVGTYGNRSSRRALIRQSNGRYVKVEVGDRVDGGRVQAIGNGVLVYVKGGRKVTLEVPGS